MKCGPFSNNVITPYGSSDEALRPSDVVHFYGFRLVQISAEMTPSASIFKNKQWNDRLNALKWSIVDTNQSAQNMTINVRAKRAKNMDNFNHIYHELRPLFQQCNILFNSRGETSGAPKGGRGGGLMGLEPPKGCQSIFCIGSKCVSCIVFY